MSSNPEATAAEATHARRGSVTVEQQEALERKLRFRPNDAEDLRSKGIIEQGHMAPSLAAAAKSLERNLISNRLNQQLSSREQPDELAETVLRGSNVAPRLRQAKVQLEHAITRDHLGHLLESRPQPAELYASGVLEPPRRSSRIQGVARQLERNMTQDKVAHLLERRPDLEELQQQNIIPVTNRVAPALQGPQRQLAHNLAKANLYHALKHRPSLAEVQKRGYIATDQAGQPLQDGSNDAHPFQQAYYQQGGQPQPDQKQSGYQQPMAYQRRSKNFHLTRILLKAVAGMAEAGDISLQQKGFLKDLIVDQDPTILSIAETFDTENDLNEFKETLYKLATTPRT